MNSYLTYDHDLQISNVVDGQGLHHRGRRRVRKWSQISSQKHGKRATNPWNFTKKWPSTPKSPQEHKENHTTWRGHCFSTWCKNIATKRDRRRRSEVLLHDRMREQRWCGNILGLFCGRVSHVLPFGVLQFFLSLGSIRVVANLQCKIFFYFASLFCCDFIFSWMWGLLN